MSTGNWVNASAIISNTSDPNPSFSFPQLQYPSPDKTYNIKLVVTSSDLCVDSIVKPVTLLARPLTQFDPITDTCGPINTTLNNTSNVNSPRTFTSYQWSIATTNANGSTATLSSTTNANPTLNITTPSTDSAVYILTLIANDNQGCADTTNQTIHIYAHPIAGFTGPPSGVCAPYNLNLLTNTSISGFTNPTTQLGTWTITKPTSSGTTTVYTSSSSEALPNFILKNTGVDDSAYTITLDVTNLKNCTHSYTNTITVHPNAKAEINATTTTDCAPFILNNTNVTSTSFPNANASVTWTVKTVGGTILYGPSAILNYTITNPNDSVLVYLDAVSLHNCADDQAVLKFKTISNPDKAWTLSSDNGCSPFTPEVSSVVLTTGVTHTWKLFDASGTLLLNAPGTGALNTSNFAPFGPVTNPSNTASAAFTIRHIVTAGTGCKDSSNLSFTVLPTPEADFTIPSQVCGLNSFTTTNTSTATANPT